MARQAGTIGQLLVNEILPKDMRDPSRVLDKKGLSTLLSEVAKRYPEQYRDISYKLGQLGREAAFTSGGNSFGLKHMRRANSAIKARQVIQAKVDDILNDDSMDDKKRDEAIIKLVGGMMSAQQDEIFKESMDEKNPLAFQLIGAGRGNKMNLASLRGSDGLYQDHRDRIIPIPVMRSYSQGLSPIEYWAGTYGARQGVMAVKFATQDAGYFGKQLNQISHRMLITGDDEETPSATLRGLPIDTDDDDSEGALLAADVAGHKRNTIITPKILADIRKAGIKRMLIRSPAVSGSPDGGLYAKDVGVREFNRVPTRGENIGLTAAQALCLSEGTLVRMADGSAKPIESIQPGELVLGCSVSGEVAPTTVLNVYDNGVKSCVEYAFRRGTGCVSPDNILTVVATPEHKFLSELVRRSGSGERVYADAVAIRPLGFVPEKGYDRFCAKLSTSFNDKGLVSEPFALLIGCLIGDGCYTGGVSGNGIGFSCYDPTEAAYLENYLLKHKIKLKPQTTVGEYRVVDLTDKQPKYRADGTYYRNRIVEWLRVRALWGQYSGNKTLPPDVHFWNNDSVAALLSGLIATDGYITASGFVGFSSNSKKLLEQIQVLLRVRFGISCSSIACSIKKKSEHENYAPNYRFVVCSKKDVIKISKLFRIPGVKQQRLEQYIQNSASTGAGNYSSRCLRIAAKHVGAVKTYDLHVEHPDHLFVLANGLIVSNSEPLSQSQLSAKHAGGVAGASKAVSGFDYINQLVQVPKTFKGGAAHATIDGIVQSVVPAPAGGYFVTINNQKHYVGSGFDVSVKRGDKIEAGDVISEGIPNPSIVTHYKGIGEGRRYFINAFRDAMKSSGLRANRRNIEVLSRGLINHVRLTDEYGNHVPDDVVPYSALESEYKPRPGFKTVEPRSAVGKYLERPYLHYTIGTKIKPSMFQNFTDFNVNSVDVHDDPPPFEPEMIRGMANLHHDPDFMTRMFGSGLKGSLLDAVHRGGTSSEAGTSFVAGRARAVDFGRIGKVITPKAPPALPTPPKATIL